MIFDEKQTGEILTVKPLTKRIDASSALNFKGHLVERIREGRHRLVLDLSGVDFIDSSGLVAIVSVLKMIGPEGDLVICGMKEEVMNLFRLTRINRVFRIFLSELDAVQSLLGRQTADGGGRRLDV